MYHIRESIRPSADLRNHYNEISKQCREENEAVIITVNGRGDTVSLSYDEYKSMKSRIELLELLAEADEDVANGRVSPIQDTFNDLRAMLKRKIKYTIVRTDTADIGIRKKVMNMARNFDEDIALKKLDDLEKNIYLLEDNPYLGITPRYPALKDKAIRC